MSLPDPMCMDPDTDGDGIPDSQDPCPDEPNPNCELVIVYGDPTDLQVECTDGTRVADATECPNYYDAMFGNRGNDQTDDDDASRRGRGDGGGGGGRGRENQGVKLRFEKPDDKTKRYEPTARNIDSCVHQGHADFRGVSYVLEFRKIFRKRDGSRAMGTANAKEGKTYLDLDEIFNENGRGRGGHGWKLELAGVSVHEMLHHVHPEWDEDDVVKESKKPMYTRVAQRCAGRN